jgi:hypothetical protein
MQQVSLPAPRENLMNASRRRPSAVVFTPPPGCAVRARRVRVRWQDPRS